ncbi:hypothetical protein CP532_0507 [Ophiocordyceps camponoti-leonardi (nom. inval.)]|nr:hypothetical protein CP532_0507 [Ophiocordyceps camponoti-leonardi (nom. inval.)]
MYDDYPSRSPSRGRHHNPGPFRDKDDDAEFRDDADDFYRSRQVMRANLPTGRRDRARSPRQDVNPYGDQQERYSRHSRGAGDRDRGFYDDRRDDRYRTRGDGYTSNRDGEMRRPRFDGRDEQDYHRGEQDYVDESAYRDDRYSHHMPNHQDQRNYQDMYDDGYRRDLDRRHSRPRGTRDADEPQRGDDRRSRFRGDDNGYEHHRRSQSRSRIRDAGKPTDTVMLEGVPRTISNSMLREGLFRSSIAVQFPTVDVRVIHTGTSSRAFVQFKNVDDATVFVKEHFPKLLVHMQHSTDDVPDGKFQVFIHFARSHGGEREGHQGSGGTDWSCASCSYRNFASRTQCKRCNAAPGRYRQSKKPEVHYGLHVPRSANGGTLERTGSHDIAREGDSKLQIICVYPLPPHIDEDMLGQEMKRLELVKPDKPKDEAPKLKSTAPSVDGAGFGARPGSLHRVFLMRKVGSEDKLPYGFAEFWTIGDAQQALKKYQMTRSFEIAGKPVTMGLIHLGVFIPEDRIPAPEIEFMSFTPIFNPTMRVRYRDLDLYASPKVVAAEPLPLEEEATKTTTTEKADGQKSKKRKADDPLTDPTVKKAPLMAAQMALWQRRHEEIAQGPAVDELPRGASVKFSLTGKTKAQTTAQPQSAKAEQPGAQAEKSAGKSDAEVSYVDRDLLLCLLCTERYKTVADVNAHEKSKRHQRAIQDPELVSKALPRIRVRDQNLAAAAAAAADTAQYRDRAKERREAHNQPDKPETKSAQQQDQTQEVNKDEGKKAAESKGAGMLAKMGWSVGSGLGAKGGGVTQALTVNAYKDGVGLGAEGGKLGDAVEVAEGRTTDNYNSYLTAAQQKARERYKKME